MKIKVSEIFYSAQGEGRFVGVPSVFLRTFGCNFTCGGFGMSRGEVSTERDDVDPKKYSKFEDLPLVSTGCDSYASWDPRFKRFSPSLETGEVVDRMLALTPNGAWQQTNGNRVHLVITGGEPLLGWQRVYPEILKHDCMADLRDLTFETNGTQALTPQFEDYLMQWQMPDLTGPREITFSVSAKLPVSGEKWEDAIRPQVVVDYERIGHTYLKFVVERVEDFDHVGRAVSEYREAGFQGSVYVMPVGGVVAVYDGNRINVADEAIKRGYYYSPRIHIDIWGNAWSK
jgi:7-carboxy-7-deazaguanine synthase